jgi:hypothetical protein
VKHGGLRQIRVLKLGGSEHGMLLAQELCPKACTRADTNEGPAFLRTEPDLLKILDCNA